MLTEIANASGEDSLAEREVLCKLLADDGVIVSIGCDLGSLKHGNAWSGTLSHVQHLIVSILLFRYSGRGSYEYLEDGLKRYGIKLEFGPELSRWFMEL